MSHRLALCAALVLGLVGCSSDDNAVNPRHNAAVPNNLQQIGRFKSSGHDIFTFCDTVTLDRLYVYYGLDGSGIAVVPKGCAETGK